MTDRQPPDSPKAPRPIFFPGLRHALEFLAGVVILIYFLAAAAILGMRYWVLPRVDDYRPQIEAIVSRAVGVPVSIEKISANWGGLYAHFHLQGVSLRAPGAKTPGLSLAQVDGTLSWSSLLHLNVRLADLTLQSPDVLIERRADGKLYAAGLPVNTQQGGNNPVLDWLLNQNAVIVRNGTLRWLDETRAQPPVALTQVRIALLNNGHQHKFGMQANPQGILSGPVDLRAEFRHPLFVRADDFKRWHGTAYAQIGTVDLAALARYAKVPDPAMSGLAAGRIWMSFDAGRLVNGTVQLAARGVRTQLGTRLAPLALDEASLTLAAQSLENGAAWQAQHVKIVMPDQQVLDVPALNGRYLPANSAHGEQVALNGQQLDLGQLARLAPALPLPADLRKPLDTWAPRGMLHDFEMSLQRPAPGAGNGWRQLPGLKRLPNSRTRYHFRAAFDHASLNSVAATPSAGPHGAPRIGIPGFTNLSGRIDANQDRGNITLDTQNTVFTFPGLFDPSQISFDQLNGKARWTIVESPPQSHQPPQVKLDIASLDLQNSQIAAHMAGTYVSGGPAHGTLDLQGHIQRAQIAGLSNYLPTTMNPDARNYLKHALLGGTAHDATFRVKGPLDAFPYAQNNGQFHMEVPLTDARLDPAPRTAGHTDSWPAFEKIQGKLIFDNNRMQLAIDSARVYDVTFGPVKGAIEDLTHDQATLDINGQVAGPTRDFVRYLNSSPVGHWIGDFTKDTQATGNGLLNLKIKLPINHTRDAKVTGSYRFLGNDVTLARGWPALSGVDGQLNFTEHGLAASQLRGHFLGNAIRADGNTNAQGALQLRVTGAISADALRAQASNPTVAKLAGLMRGTTPFSADLNTTHGSAEIVAQSDLRGLALQLPAPLGKSADSAMPARIALRPLDEKTGATGAQTQALDLTVGPVQANFVQQTGGDGTITVLRGGIGVNAAPPHPGKGVAASIDLDQLDADAWRALRLQSAASDAGSGGSDSGSGSTATMTPYAPTQVTLHAKQVTLLSRPWPDVALTAQRDGSDWQTSIASPQLAGNLHWDAPSPRVPYGEIHGRLSKLLIPKAEGGATLGQILDEPADEFPAIDLVADEFALQDKSLGRLELVARNTVDNGVPVWQLNKLNITNPAANLAITGNWRTAIRHDAAAASTKTPRRTALAFKLDIKNAGKLLDRVGLPKTLRDGSGTLSGQLDWRGGPTQIDYPTLGGQVALDLSGGQILKADPGLTKLLGIFSVQTLAKILTLDFDSVLSAGLPFDRILANGAVHDGIASTQDFTITSTSATIKMSGTTNLDKETQNLQVTVLPHINAGSASLAYALINPALGLGSFLAQLALGGQLSQSLASHYTVTGSWRDPVIRQGSPNQGKMENLSPSSQFTTP
ncbi:MAG: TIGR02099 family protein [Pandoraea sp.]|nr:MAG: TIGR02099 family protein [Pandoraea sp.]TAM15423.1 MAG: TIGR02099 family protein [Pandoraea sp.]